jgi:hypothetical protein
MPLVWRVLCGSRDRSLPAGRTILFSLCEWGVENVVEWGADVAQMYRVQVQM